MYECFFLKCMCFHWQFFKVGYFFAHFKMYWNSRYWHSAPCWPGGGSYTFSCMPGIFLIDQIRPIKKNLNGLKWQKKRSISLKLLPNCAFSISIRLLAPIPSTSHLRQIPLGPPRHKDVLQLNEQQLIDPHCLARSRPTWDLGDRRPLRDAAFRYLSTCQRNADAVHREGLPLARGALVQGLQLTITWGTFRSDAPPVTTSTILHRAKWKGHWSFPSVSLRH